MNRNLISCLNEVSKANSTDLYGEVYKVVGDMVESIGPDVCVGDLCVCESDNIKVLLEVISFDYNRIKMMSYHKTSGLIKNGTKVKSLDGNLTIKVGDGLLGRVVDGLGVTIDNKGKLENCNLERSIDTKSIGPFARKPIDTLLSTGVKAIDTMFSIGVGQRMGIFSGAGLGKTSLLGMIACNSSSDVNVFVLVGERNREVIDLTNNILGEEGLAKSVIIVATSDDTDLLKTKAPFTGITIAEYFRDCGMKVNFFIDSITRFARAQRALGISIGEPPIFRGYPASVYSLISRFLERAGNFKDGSITGFYSVLVEGDDMNEPIADNIRGILDGHIILSKERFNKGLYPAIDFSSSISRVTNDIISRKCLEEVVLKVREIIYNYNEVYDLISVGAYVPGSDPKVDYAVSIMPDLNKFFNQNIDDKLTLYDSFELLCNKILKVKFDLKNNLTK